MCMSYDTFEFFLFYKWGFCSDLHYEQQGYTGKIKVHYDFCKGCHNIVHNDNSNGTVRERDLIWGAVRFRFPGGCEHFGRLRRFFS